MISIDEAVELVNANRPQTVTGRVELDGALDRVLAEEIAAPEPLPRYTDSAMDGFAVRWEDLEGAAEGDSVSLSVTGESRAGEPFAGEVKVGEAVRISTGAMMPAGADTVVPIEDVKEVDEENRTITIPAGAVREKQSVRFRGEEIETGEMVLEEGALLTPAAIGLLARLGIETVEVYPPPATAAIVTGSELADPVADIEPWQIRDSNGIMLAAAVRSSGGEVVFSTRCGDAFEETRAAIRSAADGARVILVSGGVSVGPHDLVKEAAAEEGFETIFWQVNQKPGKPLFLARRSDTLFFGLPGNPVSALNCYAYYVYPLLQQMQGKGFSWAVLTGELARQVKNRGDRTRFIRVQVDEREGAEALVTPLGKQGSHMLSSMAAADGFILVEGGETLPEGSEVEVYLYPWRRS